MAQKTYMQAILLVLLRLVVNGVIYGFGGLLLLVGVGFLLSCPFHNQCDSDALLAIATMIPLGIFVIFGYRWLKSYISREIKKEMGSDKA